MKKILLLIVTVALVFNAIGCTASPGSKEKDKIGIRGQITKKLTDDNQNVRGILVEGRVEVDTMYDKASVGIDKDTEIYMGNSNQKLSAVELKEGIKVEVIFGGPIAESYPVQGKAKTIRTIE